MRGKPERRYRTAAELSADVGRFLEQRPIVARPPHPVQRLRATAASHKLATTALAAALLALSVFSATSWIKNRELRAKHARVVRAEEEASREAARANVEAARASAEAERASIAAAHASAEADRAKAVLDFLNGTLSEARVDESGTERFDGGGSQIDQAGVETGCVLAFEQAQAAEPVGPGDPGAGKVLGQQLGGTVLLARIHRGERSGDHDRIEASIVEPLGGVDHGRFVERLERATVELDTAGHQDRQALHRCGELRGPADERWKACPGGETDSEESDTVEVAPLDHGVGEVGGPDDHGPDIGVVDAGQCRSHPAHDIVGGGGLVRRDDGATVESGDVGVGPADVDADP